MRSELHAPTSFGMLPAMHRGLCGLRSGLLGLLMWPLACFGNYSGKADDGEGAGTSSSSGSASTESQGTGSSDGDDTTDAAGGTDTSTGDGTTSHSDTTGSLTVNTVGDGSVSSTSSSSSVSGDTTGSGSDPTGLGSTSGPSTDPSTTDSSTTDSSTTDSSTTDSSDPSTTNPSTTNPSTTNPSTTNPSTDDSSTIDPTGACVPDCAGLACGPDPNCGEDCGSCGSEICFEQDFCGRYIGEYNDLGSYGSLFAGYLVATNVSIVGSFKLKRFGIRVHSGAGKKLKMALYSDSGGAPDALKAQTSEIVLVNGINEVSVSEIALMAGSYWIAILPDADFTIRQSGSLGNSYVYAARSYADGIPATFGLVMNANNAPKLNWWIVVD